MYARPFIAVKLGLEISIVASREAGGLRRRGSCVAVYYCIQLARKMAVCGGRRDSYDT